MNIDKLSSFISIMSDYDTSFHYFTYNGKIITNPITITDNDELNKIYFINESIHQFIKNIINNKTDFIINNYRKKCITYNTPRLVNTKCIESTVYTNNNIALTIINNSTTSNYKVTKFACISKNIILIMLDDIDTKYTESDSIKLSQLTLVAKTLSSSSAIKSNNDEIVEKFLSTKITKT